jgi:hypothetical protein
MWLSLIVAFAAAWFESSGLVYQRRGNVTDRWKIGEISAQRIAHWMSGIDTRRFVYFAAA